MSEKTTTTWYEVLSYEGLPREVQVLKETPHKVQILQKDHWGKSIRWHNKISDYSRFFPTRAEAVAFLRVRLQRSISSSQEKIEQCKQALSALAEE